MNRRTHPAEPTPDRPGEVLLSVNRITFPDDAPQGVLAPWEGDAPVLPSSLRGHRSPRGRWYDEEHLEVWLARDPAAVLPGRRVLVLAAEKYASLGCIDLLLLDDLWRLHVLELKARRVARNGGETPDAIQGQMNGYVDHLARLLPRFPESLDEYYGRFTEKFLGSRRRLAEDMNARFGVSCPPTGDRRPVIRRTYLAEGYDDHAVDYFRARQQHDGPIRLVFYRFFPDPAEPRIEFREVCLTDATASSIPGGDGSSFCPVVIAPPGPAAANANPAVDPGAGAPADRSIHVTPAPAETSEPDPPKAARLVLAPGAYILERQVLWARRHGVALQGSAGDRGRPAYATTLDDNLFEPLSAEARREYEQGQGDELGGNMRAVHSSSALACNVFHYWKSRGNPGPVATACGFPAAGVEAIRFEPRFPVTTAPMRSVFPHDPNPDAAFLYATGRKVRAAAVECKLGEPYDPRGHHGLSPTYLGQPGLWAGLPHCEAMARRLSPTDREFECLHAAQLLKHILGLRHAYAPGGFILAYLWYDVPGQAGVQHRREVERFADTVRQDGIDFRPVTYQEVILGLSRAHRDGHTAYIDYLAERYL